MVEIVCDNCEKSFRVDPVEAGPKVKCPMCGDVNRVPGEESPVPDRPVATPAAAPATPSDTPHGTVEEEICVIRPAMFRAHPWRYLGILLLFFGGLGLGIFFFALPWVSIPAGILALGAAIWFGLWWLSTHWWLKLIISNKRTVRHEGIIRRHTTEVLHDHVRSVDIRQTFLQRIFKVGSLGIDSAGQEDIEIEVSDIPKPYEVKAIIDRYRKM